MKNWSLMSKLVMAVFMVGLAMMSSGLVKTAEARPGESCYAQAKGLERAAYGMLNGADRVDTQKMFGASDLCVLGGPSLKAYDLFTTGYQGRTPLITIVEHYPYGAKTPTYISTTNYRNGFKTASCPNGKVKITQKMKNSKPRTVCDNWGPVGE